MNVLLLIADDWSPLAACYGNSVIQTPNIDALARRATVFDHAFCTTPSCAASRANILTGQYSHAHKQYGHSHDPHGFRTHGAFAEKSLPAVLRHNGVYSGLIGKDHIAPHSAYPFDFFEKGNPGSVDAMRQSARRFFAGRDGRPFYLQAASKYPHRTSDAGFDPEQCADELKPGDVSYAPEDVIAPDWLPDTEATRRDLADYYRFVSRFDRFVGAMLEELEAAGQAENTAVILMSDHGMPFPGAKASFYDSGHHCPLIVSRPGGKALHNNALVNWSDIFPTVADLLGMQSDALPDDLAGRSFLPVLDQSEPEGWDRTFFSHTFHGIGEFYPYRVLRERRFKFVQFLAHGLPMPIPVDLYDSPTWRDVREKLPGKLGQRDATASLYHEPEELYDLEADPHETTNLADRPEYAETVERMRRDLLALRRETGDPFPIDQGPPYPDPRVKT